MLLAFSEKANLSTKFTSVYNLVQLNVEYFWLVNERFLFNLLFTWID